MIRRPPISTLTDPLFPYTTLFRSADEVRIFVGNNSGLKKPMLVYRVSIVGSGTAGAAPPAPAWVATLKDSVVAATGGPQQPMTQADKVGMNAFMVGVRSEERRGGKEGVSKGRSRWSPYH